MKTRVLVGYATRYGSTREVAETIAEAVRGAGLDAEVQPLRQVRSLEGYGAVVIGAALYMYHWHKDARRFLARHRAALAERPVALFALGPTHDPHDDKEWLDSRAQLDQDLAQFPWLKPVAIGLFGGKFDPAALRFPLNKLAGSAPASDIRDWTAIRAWAVEVARLLVA